MSITSGYFDLTPEQRHFQAMLTHYPRFSGYWDFANRACDLDAINTELGTMSHGEQIMLRFFVAVWCGSNVVEFDFIDAARSLDDPDRQVIAEWLGNPVLP